MGRVTVLDTPADLREAPCLTDEEIRALAAVARRVEAHYGAPQDIEWAVLDAPFADAPVPDAPADPPAPDALAESRVVLLQSRPETVWAARDAKPAGAPKARAADHVLALFGKPL
jgi:pyruvate,water dikinase